DYLRKAFAAEPAILPPPAETAGTRSSHHLYPLRINPEALGADIQALKQKLKEKGVTEIAHFGPMYMFRVLEQLGYDGKAALATCPNTERMFHRGYTHLPLYPLTFAQVRYMANAVLESVAELRS
ncbi:MAG: DegT/DnrJ/EryC1/StrS family aminotransferase, partial [Verrucomicrobiia bacterium]